MIFFKRIVIIKIVVMICLSIYFAELNDDKLYQLMYVFNIFCVLLSLIYIYPSFKYINENEFSLKKYIVLNLIVIFSLVPLMLLVFTPLMSVINCILFSLNVVDGIYFGLLLLKHGKDSVINSDFIKLIIRDSLYKK